MKVPLKSMEISYRNTDDGIWMDCMICGGEENLGFYPLISDVVKAAKKHCRKRHTS